MFRSAVMHRIAFLFVLASSCGQAAIENGPAQAGPLIRVEVEVLGLGLGGHVADGPAVLRYRLHNPGPAREVGLEVREIPKEGPIPGPGFMERNGIVPRTLDLARGETRGTWVLPSVMSTYGPAPIDHHTLAVVDSSGRVAGSARLPDLGYGNVVAVVAASDDAARRIRDAVESGWEGKPAQASSPPVVRLTGALPRLWHEWRPATFVILARPWTSLEEPTRTSISHWISLGGRLVVVAGDCPDWALGPWGPGVRYGAGRIHVREQEADLGEWLFEQGLLEWAPYVGPPTGLYPEIFHSRYVLPSTWALIGFILLIIVVIGPVVHLALSAVRRREWAWIAVPAASVVMAVGMYALASSIKGEGTVLEVHRIHHAVAGGPDSSISTVIRLMSPARRGYTLEGTGLEPWITPTMTAYRTKATRTVIGPDGIRLLDIDMQRWSVRDFTYASRGGQLPLAATCTAERIEIENTGSLALRDLFLKTSSGWTAVGPVLDPGAKVSLERPGSVQLAKDLDPSWPIEGGMEQRALLLEFAAQGYISTQPCVLVADCDASPATEVGISPPPDKTYGSSTCVWTILEKSP